jgi:hypothetical protein
LGQQLFLLVFSSLKLTGLNSKIRIEKAFMDPEKSWFFRIALRGISAIRGEWENILKNVFPLIDWKHEYFLDWIHASNNKGNWLCNFWNQFPKFASIANKVTENTGAEIPAFSAVNTQGLGFPYFRNKKGNLEVWVLSDG